MSKLNKTENFNTSEGNVKENNIFYKDCCDKFIDYVKKSHNEQDLERVADNSKTLTEKWKKGELPEGEKYIQLRDNRVFTAYFNGKEFREVYNSDIKEILAPVPSYDELVYLHKAKNDAHEIVESLTQEKSRLRRFVDFVGGIKCPKCGEYYMEGYKCHNCGFDNSI